MGLFASVLHSVRPYMTAQVPPSKIGHSCGSRRSIGTGIARKPATHRKAPCGWRLGLDRIRKPLSICLLPVQTMLLSRNGCKALSLA